MYKLVCWWVISHKFLKPSSLYYFWLFTSLMRWFLMLCLRVHWSFLDLVWCWIPLLKFVSLFIVFFSSKISVWYSSNFYLLAANHAFLLTSMSSFMMAGLNSLSGKSSLGVDFWRFSLFLQDSFPRFFISLDLLYWYLHNGKNNHFFQSSQIGLKQEEIFADQPSQRLRVTSQTFRLVWICLWS